MILLRPLALCIYKNFKLLLIRYDSWTAKKLVPDVIDIPPKETLVVKYPNVTVSEGKVIQAKQTKYKPTVTWNLHEKGLYYTLIMSDIDAPSRQKPNLREWHHWLIGNIPDNNLEAGQVLTEYIGAGPPKGTGLHRFAFLLFKQPGKLEFPQYKISKKHFKGRPKFSSRKFKMKHNLELYAGNFFEAEYDDFVDELHKQIQLKEYIDLTKPHF